MVYSPCKFLVPAAIALVASQMQQAAGYSMFYAPETVSGTTDELTSQFPAYGAEVADQDCVFTVEIDPTLPNITTIPVVPVTYPDLLANVSTAPLEPVDTKVGTPVIQETTPIEDAEQDAYTDGSDAQYFNGTTPEAKTGITTTDAPSTDATDAPSTDVQGDADKDNCATGWEQSGRKLRDSAVSGHDVDSRRLEVTSSKDITKLETFFGKTMETTLKNLPTKASQTPSPWPGPYWPTYQDGINVVWSAGQPSAAEKYAKAFGLNVKDFMNKVSADTGIDSQSGRRKCSKNTDCNGLTDGSECAIRAGKTSGYCIPTWFGICHAWSPAALLETEPKCPVTYNGVTFQPMDLKALLSDIYDGASVATVFTGARYNGAADSKDGYGRHTNAAFRDLNPGFFHIAAANLLGKLKTSFVVDVTAGSEVWNQPVRGFNVVQQTAMSLKQAASTFYGLSTYPWNSAAKSIVYVKTRLSWIYETYTDGGLVSNGQVDEYTTGAYYYYLLELDAAGKIIGGEWVYNSRDTHPDFLWFPKAKPAANTVTSVGLKYADVSMLLQKSQSGC